MQYDLVIVGGGMVGATLACLVGQQCESLSIAVLEAGDGQYSEPPLSETFDPRVVALSGTSQAVLQEAQVWSLIEQYRHCPYLKMQVWDGEGTGRYRIGDRRS